MSAPTIASEWDHFKAVDIAPTAPAVQLAEMRKAFYAGAASGVKLRTMLTAQEILIEMREYIAAEDRRRASKPQGESK